MAKLQAVTLGTLLMVILTAVSPAGAESEQRSVTVKAGPLNGLNRGQWGWNCLLGMQEHDHR